MSGVFKLLQILIILSALSVNKKCYQVDFQEVNFLSFLKITVSFAELWRLILIEDI